MRYVLIAVLLSGCATPEERGAKLAERYGGSCDALGYARNTDPWRDCVLKMEGNRRRAQHVIVQ